MGKKYRKRRSWSDDEKAMICAQTRERGVSVSQVARRYDVNANQVFNWLKDPRFADDSLPDAEQCFLPIEIIEEVPARRSAVTGLSILEIDVVGGHRLRITGAYDADALARLIRGLSE